MASLVSDAVLPAAAFLTSDSAADVLAPAVAATGRRLLACTAVQVQYRPGSDLVVRYRAETAAPDGALHVATLLAGTTANGPHPGTLAVEANSDDGGTLRVGVWQWPFDPVLTGLSDLVTPGRAQVLLRHVLDGRPQLDVVVYRPAERAVVRATDGGGRTVYVKAIPPALVGGLVERHAALGSAGLPVPAVLAASVTDGLVVLGELPGPTLRERLKLQAGPWPDAEAFLGIRSRLASVALPDGALRPSRRSDARAHAAMLAGVLGDAEGRLVELVERVGQPVLGSTTIHGDLHEGQLIIDHEGRLTGLLDIDDVALGDPLDDLATVLGHLRYRAMTERRPDAGARFHAYADALRVGFGAALASGDVDPAELDVSTAAVLIGLATGPFRVRMDAWQMVTRDVIDLAERLSS